MLNTPWFMSGRPEIIRAGLFMLDGAWRNDPQGSLPADFARLALICRLPLADLQENFPILSAGWELRGELLIHHELTRIGESLIERFGDELGVMAESAVVAIQGASQEFDLFSPVEIKKRKGGKTAIPKDFAADKASEQALQSYGYVTEAQKKWVLQRYIDFAVPRDSRLTAAQWQASFRSYAGKSWTLEDFRASDVFRSSALVAVEPPPSGRRLLDASLRGQRSAPPLFSARVADANQQMFAATLARRQAPAMADDADGQGMRP